MLVFLFCSSMATLQLEINKNDSHRQVGTQRQNSNSECATNNWGRSKPEDGRSLGRKDSYRRHLPKRGSPMPGAKEDIPGATDGRGHYGPAQHEMKAYSFEGKDGHSV